MDTKHPYNESQVMYYFDIKPSPILRGEREGAL